jgi:large subunit ribosomal protein L14
MIYKLTTFVPSDRCGVWLVRVFHTYTKRRNFLKQGEFGKISIQQTRPFNKLRKKKKNKFFCIRTKQVYWKLDGSVYRFFENSGVLLKKRLQPRGKRVYGPTSTYIRRKRVVNVYKYVL